MSNYNLRNLYLKDALDLYESFGEEEPAFAKNSSGRVSVNSVRTNLSEFLEDNRNSAFVWEEERSNKSNLDEVSDIFTENLLYLFCSQLFLNKGELSVEVYIPQSNLNKHLNYEGFINSFLDLIANNDKVQVINIKIPDYYKDLVKYFNELGFIESDISINVGTKFQGDRNVWMKTFIMDKLSNWPSTWAFVPTEQAVFAIYGNEKKITQTKFINYSEYLEDISLRSLCINNKLADCNGYLLKDYATAMKEYKKDFNNLPASLKNAVQQSEEYFAGKRKKFDLPIVFDNFTSFQKLVWEKTRNIPYGSVYSYEDLAIEITGNSNLNPNSFSRAVGQALSNNPLVVFIPCHRIIAKSGNLQGYKYDVKVKDWLLTKEMLSW